MIEGGTPDDEAIRIATEDSTLDEYVTLAPIVSFGAMLERKRQSIAQGNRLGSFPVCPYREMPPAYVDLTRMSTVHYQTVPTNTQLSAISELATGHLQRALAAHFAYRSFSKLRELEAAVGRRIDRVTCTTTAKRLSVLLVLDNGETLALEGNRNPELRAGPDRAARR